ncbi:MAG: BON domain-containing protein [Janthinobacterium lividum]
MANQINLRSKLNINLQFIFFVFMLISISCGQQNQDKNIKADLSAKAKNELNFANVNFTVADGVVTLIGNCGSEKSKNAVEQTVKSINIIKGIDDKIVIAPVTINADLPLKQNVDSVLANYPAVEANITAGTIILQGKTKQQDADKILAALNNLHSGKIKNELTVN